MPVGPSGEWVCIATRCDRAEDGSRAGQPSNHYDAIIAAKDRRIQELLESNNRYLERARAAEAEVERLKGMQTGVRVGPDWRPDGAGWLVSPDGLLHVLAAPHAAAPLPAAHNGTISISPRTTWESGKGAV